MLAKDRISYLVFAGERGISADGVAETTLRTAGTGLGKGRKRNALAEVREALAGDPQLTAAQRRMRQIEAQHSERNAQWQSAQLAAQRLEEQLKNVENRLYGGAVTNVRELEAFQEEQAALQNRISAAEDTLLEHMIATEEASERA